MFKRPKHFAKGPEEELAQKKEKSPVEAPQASTSKNLPQKISKQRQASPKKQSEGQSKGKVQIEQVFPSELLNSKERKDRHGQCVQYGKDFDLIQKQRVGKNESSLSKEIEFLKLVSHIETCNDKILETFDNFEYIKQKLGREILQVK
ncbi:hypothetical protein O181_096932 [Austropuccinia psidii MF-1]|uniref:Uncharacterized protein n=1 Tax=Austropuccinia psidii MF-1 TaxID=1389203 RepID=A0A9Q3J7K7_9BASI|nr:hypothetical protein [Austropuccinia psidii MF-1]